MKKMSIKLRLTLWFVGFMLLISALCFGSMLLVGNRVSREQTASILSATVRGDLSRISYTDGMLSVDEELRFYENGVYIIIYNDQGSMLTGRTPPDLPVDTELENGVTKSVETEENTYLVFDLYIPSGWEDGIWIRGASVLTDISSSIYQSAAVFLLLLPILIAAAAVGGYLIAKRALRPIEEITLIAENISEGKDLSRRVSAEYSLSEGSGKDTAEKKRTDEAGKLANAFDHMMERLERSFETEQRFTSDASHELRTPTSVIVAQCAYLDRYAETAEDYKEGVVVIERQAGYMSTLIDRLLDITRMDIGSRQLKLEETDLSELIKLICETMGQDGGEAPLSDKEKGKGISLITNIEPNVRKEVDSYLITRVVSNLIDNAEKYGKDGGHIWVSLEKDDDDAVIQVKDDGIGISEEELPKIWRRFYQVDLARSEGSGLGLGLSMVKQIIELHGGSIEAESHLGEGSCFTARL